ncbi:MAG: diphosphomevalonate decarboxylase [Spartobacteria bacterium]|nr:diphosphomevalonate decarboxylase [Spartobacteria bacterium]
MITKQDIVHRILGDKPSAPKDVGTAYAPANIALCKYWGKRNDELNLPVTSSLSVSLNQLGATTTVRAGGDKDQLVLNGCPLASSDPAAKRLFAFLELFRPIPDCHFAVESESTIPVAAGLASSASGFAALVMALDDLFQWRLSPRELSILARMGSGSAARSVASGFVEWQAGSRDDGMDSHAVPLPEHWEEFCLGILMISEKQKPESSRAAMKRTCETSLLYRMWPERVAHDMARLRAAIAGRDFEQLGQAAESNALAMHATMLDTWPPVLYWLPESVQAMQRVWALRKDGHAVYFTMDAGPNIKLLYLARNEPAIQAAFPELVPVRPFGTA